MRHFFVHVRTTLTLLALVFCMSASTRSTQKAASQPDLAIEMINGNRLPIEFYAFNGAGAGGISPIFINKTANPDRSTTVSSISLEVTRDAQIVIIALSLTMENDKKILVANYRLKENEAVRTEELTKYGVEPLSLKVVRAKPKDPEPSPPIQPLIDNKTKSLHVVGFSRSLHSASSFELSLRNISTKPIIALSLWIPSANGNGGQGQSARGNKSYPVMLPGAQAIYHINVSVGGRRTPSGYVLDAPGQQTLISRTAVFDDGTFEGPLEPAAEMISFQKGVSIQRARISQLLEETTKSNLSFEQLKEKAYDLNKSVDDSGARELIQLFPTLKDVSKEILLNHVANGLHDGKREFLHRLGGFTENQKQERSVETFHDWLKRTRDEYARLIDKD